MDFHLGAFIGRVAVASVRCSVTIGSVTVDAVTKRTLGWESNKNEVHESLYQTLPMHKKVWMWNYVVAVTTLSITWSNYSIMTNEGITREIYA